MLAVGFKALSIILLCALGILVPTVAWAPQPWTAIPFYEVGLSAVFCLFLISITFPSIRMPAIGKLDIVLFLLLGWAIASAFYMDTRTVVKPFVEMLLLFFVLSHFGFSRNQPLAVLLALLTTGGLMALASLSYKLPINRNLFSGYLSLLLPMSLYLWKCRSTWAKLAGVLLTTVLAFGMAHTLTRGGYIACVAGMLVFALIKDRRLLVVPVIYVFVCGAMVPEARSRVLSLAKTPSVVQAEPAEIDPTMVSRRHVWELAWHKFQTAPVTGIGYGNFKKQLDDYRKQNPQDTRFPETVDVHNTFLQALCELGLPGLILLLSFFAAATWPAAKGLVRIKWRDLDPLAVAVLCGIAAYLLHNLTNSLLFKTPPVVFGFWIALGLLPGLFKKGDTDPGGCAGSNRLQLGRH